MSDVNADVYVYVYVNYEHCLSDEMENLFIHPDMHKIVSFIISHRSEYLSEGYIEIWKNGQWVDYILVENKSYEKIIGEIIESMMIF